jgi:hypothetical protein
MTPKTWKSCLGVLCLLAAGTANAAKISFSEKGFIDVGALVQAQYRIEQDAAATGSDPSNDFLLRRARILLSGQFDEHINFILSTEISYGAIGPAGSNAVPGGTNSGAAGSTYVGGTGAGFNNAIYLNDALASYKVDKQLIIDAGLMLVPYSHNAETGSGNFFTVNIFPSFFAPNSQRNTRDVGVLIRGLLLDDRLYYRLGVFNGVQTVGTPTGTANINAGDAPLFAGMLRFNFAGKEEGYAWCQMCFASSPIISVGVAANYQANAYRATVQRSPTTTGIVKGKWLVVNGDIFFDFPFSKDVELSVDALFTKVWAGDETTPTTGNPFNSPANGYGVFAALALRFGVIAPFGQIEWFQSDAAYLGRTVTGTPPVTTVNSTGDVKTYRFGLNWYLLKNTYKISAEMSFQARQKAGATDASVGGTPPFTTPVITDNHWLGTLQASVVF